MSLQLPSGRILFAFRNHNHDASLVRYTYYCITVCASDDGGYTSSFLSHVAYRAATDKNNGLWEPFPRIALDAAVQAFFSSGNRATGQDYLLR